MDGGLDEVLLQDLQSSSRDSPPLLPVLIGTHSAVDTASTVPVMFLGDDPTLPEPVFLLTNFPTSDQQYPVSILHRNLQLQRDAELQLQLSSLVSERSSSPAVSLSPHLPSPTLSPSSPSSTSTALTLYRLNDGGIHCQLGDVTIASSATPPSHSPGIMPRMSRTPSASTLSRITALNMWLDSSLSPVSHDDTSNASPLIPSLPLGKSVPSTMLSLLHFLKRHCNSENATYWIVTDPRDGSVKLFSFASQAPSAAFTLLPSFRKPVAQLCLRAADRLYGKRLSPNTSHPTTFPTVPDAVDVASDSFDRKLCSHLYSRALELLSLPGEWLTWVHIHGRLASVDLDGHLYPVSPKHGYTTSSCDYQVWLQLEALPSRSSVPLPSTTVDLLDNEQVLLDAALAALPRWLRCRHTLQKTLHAAVCDSSPGLVSDGTSVIPLEAIRTEAQCRSSIGHALLLIAKLDLLQGHLGRALQLCGVVNGMLEIPFHPESTWVLGCHCFNEVRAEVYAVVGRVYMELASQLQSCRSAVDALHILSIHQSELTDTLPTISPGRTSDVVGDAQWLSVPTALLMVPIAAPTSSAVAALLAARDSSESSSISCKCHHPQPPTLFGSLADLPGYSPSAALPVDVESCYNSAIQVFIRVLRTSAGPPSAASHSTSPWFTHVIPWLQYAYSGVGEHFLRNGRFTKAAQVTPLLSLCAHFCFCDPYSHHLSLSTCRSTSPKAGSYLLR